MKNLISALCVLVCSISLFSCREEKKVTINDAELLHQNEDQLTQIIIYDVFSPPVAARIYAYTSIASYEAIRYSKPGSPSVAEKMNGFTAIIRIVAYANKVNMSSFKSDICICE